MSKLSEEEDVEGGNVGVVDEVLEVVGFFGGDLTVLDEVGVPESEHVFSVVLPHSSVVGFVAHFLGLLVGVHQVVLGEEFGSHFADGVPFLLEGFSALGGGGVVAESEWQFLVSVGEGLNILLGLVVVASVSDPSGLGSFVIEQSGGCTFSILLKSEPSKGIWFQSLTSKLLRSPFGVQVIHGIVPCLS